MKLILVLFLFACVGFAVAGYGAGTPGVYDPWTYYYGGYDRYGSNRPQPRPYGERRYGYGNQYGSQYGNQYGNQYGSQYGNQNGYGSSYGQYYQSNQYPSSSYGRYDYGYNNYKTATSGVGYDRYPRT